MKLPAFLTKEIKLDNFTVVGIVVAMLIVSIFTVDRFVGLPFQGQAASVYGPLPTPRPTHSGATKSVRKVEDTKKTDKNETLRKRCAKQKKKSPICKALEKPLRNR